MENDYSLFEEKIEMKKENNISKDFKKENNTKIFIVILIILGLIIFYNSIKNNINEIQTLDNKEIIVLANKFNNTKKPWNILNKFTKIFELYRLYNLYDDYIGTPLNITNKIKEFYNLNLTLDIFDLENYIKIKDFLGIDGDLKEAMVNGAFALSLIKGTDIFTIIFEKEFFMKLLKNKKLLSLNIAQFLLLTAIFYFAQQIDYKDILSYAYEFYKQYYNFEENGLNNTKLNNTNLNNTNITY